MQRVSTAGSRRAATAVLLLAAVFAFSFSTVSAHPHPHHSRNPDKVRALVATDTPDPVEAPGFSVLSLQAAVRRVDGLKADDDDDRHEDHDNRKSQTTFVLRCFWTISSGSTIVRQLVREVEIQPPFATVKLANRHGRGTKSFARVDATTSWDLKSASGVLVDAGVYNYQVFAEFIRIRTKKGKVKEKEIDDSETLSGTITVRKAPPPVITVTSPQDGALTRESFVTVSGSVTGQDPLSVSVNSQAVALTNGTFSYPLALPEGSTTITAVVTDGIGRSDQKVVTAIRDSVVPKVTITLPATGSALPTALPTLAATYSDPAPSSNLDLTSFEALLDGQSVRGLFSVSADQATATIATPLTDGSHQLVIRINDLAGGAGEAMSTFFVDTQAPTILASPTNDATLSSATPVLSATFDDPVPSSGLDTRSFLARLDNQNLTSSYSIGASSASFTPPAPLAQGSHLIEYTVADRANNVTTVVSRLFIDSVPPLITVSPITGKVLSTNQPTLSASYADPSPSSGLDTSSFKATLNGTEITAAFVVGAVQATWVIPSSAPLSDASHTLRVQVADRVGQVSTAQTVFLVDTKAPSIQVVSPSNGSTIATSSPLLGVVYSDPAPGSGISVQTFQALLDGENRTAEFLASVNGASLQISPQGLLTQGPHTLTVSVSDAAGHVSTATSQFTIFTPPASAPPGGGFASGVVFNAVTNKPIAGVTVVAVDQSGRASTDATGRFALPLAGGNARILISAPGFAGPVERQVTIQSGRDAAVPPIGLVPVDGQVSMISVAQGGIASDSAGIVKISIPPGGIGQDVPITITPLMTSEALPGGMPPATFAAQSFSIDSNGVEPAVPLTVMMRNRLGLRAGHRLVMYYFDDATGRWGVSGSGQVSADGQTLFATTNHFSILAYG